MKIWKTFRGVPREKSMYCDSFCWFWFVLRGYVGSCADGIGLLSDYIDVQKGIAGQFQLIWMSVSELSLAIRILEDKIRNLGDGKENKRFKKECQKLKEAMMTARKWKQKEEMQDQCCW